MRLYAMPSSGNSFKVRVALALLSVEHELVPCEYGSEALAELKARVGMGKVPVLELPDGTLLTESNAILLYLTRGTALLPEDALAQAQVHAWMFFEQNRHETVIATRAGNLCYPGRSASAEAMAAMLASGQEVLAIMDQALAGRTWLVGDGLTVADIALYAYTHTAEERGGFDLSGMPHLRAWLDRVAGALPAVGLPMPPSA